MCFVGLAEPKTEGWLLKLQQGLRKFEASPLSPDGLHVLKKSLHGHSGAFRGSEFLGTLFGTFVTAAATAALQGI